jgi:uncharacterized protein (DUF1800 family)
MSIPAWIACSRFGLGPRPGELPEAATDPRGWLKGQLRDAGIPAAFDGLPAAEPLLAELLTKRERGGDGVAEMVIRERFVPAYLREVAARMQARVESRQPFLERLASFWSNHFTVSVQKPIVLALAGAYEREGIRPHLLGRLEDMLLAVVRHPAMLAYLDNLTSFGPNSRVGKRRKQGLNENLAREILELHTLGVDGGYAQDDVTALARMLTGWTVESAKMGHPGRFHFFDLVHEPGPKTFLGRSWPEDGADEAVAALRHLARHPSTARHVARKLARHFCADDPPVRLAGALERRFLETGGDLAELAETLIAAPECWSAEPGKLRGPDDFVTASLRALDLPSPPADKLVASLTILGQPTFAAPSPAGWPDRAADWMSPEALLQRAEWSMAVAQKVAGRAGPAELLDQTVGPLADPATRLAVQRAPTQADGLALALASPAFQRR